MNKLLKYLIIIQLLTVSFEAFGQNLLCNEKIYLQTDRDVYIAGEDVFFNCICYSPKPNNRAALSNLVYLTLRNENNIIVSGICLKLKNNTFSGSIILPDTLSTGRYQLVSYTNTMRNFAESNYFKKEILVANRFDRELFRIYSGTLKIDSSIVNLKRGGYYPQNDVVKIEPEKSQYVKREKIKVALRAMGMKENESAQLAVSVREKTYQQDQQQNIINTTLLNNKNNCRHFPEINSVVLEGQVMSTDIDQAMPNVLVYLSTPDTLSNLQLTHTDKDGIFRFHLNDYYNLKNLIISLPDNPSGKIVLDDKYSLKEPFNPSRIFSDTLIKDYLIKSQGIVLIQKDYKISIEKNLQDTVAVNSIPPLAYPPVTDPVYPSDFVELTDFVEISRELLPLLQTRKREFGYESRFLNISKSEYYSESPLVILDGVPINSINQIITLGTEKLHKIETIGVERFYGGKLFTGILAVFSKNMEINNIVWKSPMVNINYVQLQPRSELVRSNYSKSDKTPDFRQLLYWNPNISMKANEVDNFEFLASDNKGEFEISVEGITSDGRFINSRVTIKIGSNLK